MSLPIWMREAQDGCRRSGSPVRTPNYGYLFIKKKYTKAASMIIASRRAITRGDLSILVPGIHREQILGGGPALAPLPVCGVCVASCKRRRGKAEDGYKRTGTVAPEA